jgi:hypothetical protein
MDLLGLLYQVVGLAQLGFTIWMAVDAYRRQADWYWFFVIICFPGVGPWIYFFAVKLGDFSGFSGLRDWSFLQRRPALEELRYRAEQMPTLTNRLALAERLCEIKDYEEAVPHLEAVLAQEPDLSQPRYLLALARAEEGQPEQAVPLLEKLIARDRTWSNYAAWHLLIRIQGENGAGDKALATCRELARLAPTLQHQCLLAERLLAEGQDDEARQLLQRSLEEHQYAPGFIRRRNHRWASRARQLQKQIS